MQGEKRLFSHVEIAIAILNELAMKLSNIERLMTNPF